MWVVVALVYVIVGILGSDPILSECTDHPQAFFTPHHLPRCCNNAIWRPLLHLACFLLSQIIVSKASIALISQTIVAHKCIPTVCLDTLQYHCCSVGSNSEIQCATLWFKTGYELNPLLNKTDWFTSEV